jgi:hypothetical protein
MRARPLFLLILAAGLFIAAHTGWTQSKPGTSIDVFRTVKPGQWVQLEGVPQRDFTVMTTEIKVLTGDFQDDDWEAFGTVRAVRKENKEFDLLLVKMKVNADTDFETEELNSKFKGIADLKPGMLVEIEGTYLKDGSFLVNEVQDETKGKADEAGTVTFRGKVEKIDPVKRTVTVMGIKFTITSNTQTKSAVK